MTDVLITRKRDKQGECHVMMEAEIGASNAKDGSHPQKLEDARKFSSFQVSKGARPH
jgi:hypothetical protein